MISLKKYGTVAAVVLGLCACSSSATTKATVDAGGTADTGAACKAGDPVPATIDPTGNVYRITDLVMENPSDSAKFIPSALNGLWSADLNKDPPLLNIFFKLKLWDPTNHKITLAVGTGKKDDVGYYWDGAPSDIALTIDNPHAATPGTFGVGLLPIQPGTVNTPIKIRDLAIQADVTCDANGINNGYLQGSITREDAMPILVEMTMAGKPVSIGLVNFLETAEIFPDKSRNMVGCDPTKPETCIAEPCHSQTVLAGKPERDGWCIPKEMFDDNGNTDLKVTSTFWVKDCAKTQGCKPSNPPDLAAGAAGTPAEVCAVHIVAGAKTETKCVVPDSWHFTGNFSAAKITNIRDAK